MAKAHEQEFHKGIFWFIPSGILRDAVELIFSAIPGALLLTFFIIVSGALTASFPGSEFAYTYVPEICLLPIVVGIITPLLLERIRGTTTISLKRGVASSFLAGFSGSLLSAAALLGMVMFFGTSPESNPLGPWFDTLLMQAVFLIMLIALSTILSVVGGALVVIFLNKSTGK